jgi:hypothetical protein
MSSDNHTFNIWCLRKNGELLEQALVKENSDSYSIKINPLHHEINHIDSFLKELFELMMKYEKEQPYQYESSLYKTKRYNYPNDEFVEATIFHRVLMRKGSYFYVYQKSDRGVRFLLYAMNRVHHSSVSLGFSMRLPNVDEERKEMQRILSNQTISLDKAVINDTTKYFL